MLGGEVSGGAARFVIGDQVDFALAPQLHILRAVPGDLREAHRGEHRFKHAFDRGAEFDEFEAVEAQRVFEQVSHDGSEFGFKRNRIVAPQGT